MRLNRWRGMARWCTAACLFWGHSLAAAETGSGIPLERFSGWSFSSETQFQSFVTAQQCAPELASEQFTGAVLVGWYQGLAGAAGDPNSTAPFFSRILRYKFATILKTAPFEKKLKAATPGFLEYVANTYPRSLGQPGMTHERMIAAANDLVQQLPKVAANTELRLLSGPLILKFLREDGCWRASDISYLGGTDIPEIANVLPGPRAQPKLHFEPPFSTEYLIPAPFRGRGADSCEALVSAYEQARKKGNLEAFNELVYVYNLNLIDLRSYQIKIVYDLKQAPANTTLRLFHQPTLLQPANPMLPNQKQRRYNISAVGELIVDRGESQTNRFMRFTKYPIGVTKGRCYIIGGENGGA